MARCHGLRARHEGVDLQVLLGRVRIAADGTDPAQRRAADAGREAGIGAPAGEFAGDPQTRRRQPPPGSSETAASASGVRRDAAGTRL